MKRKLVTKRGFTLVELVVVIAILAIIAAVATPLAFGSIQHAKDGAAIGSINSIQSVLRTARTIAYADNAFQSDLTNWKSGFIEYVDGKFKRVSTDPAGNAYENYMIAALEEAQIHIVKGTYIFMVLNENADKSLPYNFIFYAPNGGKRTGSSPNPVYNKPYYMFDSKLGTVTKYDKDGSSEIIN